MLLDVSRLEGFDVVIDHLGLMRVSHPLKYLGEFIVGLSQELSKITVLQVKNSILEGDIPLGQI